MKSRREIATKGLAMAVLAASLAVGLGSGAAILLTAAALSLGEMTKPRSGMRRFKPRVNPVDHTRARRPAGTV